MGEFAGWGEIVNLFTLNGKRAVITGTASGIGLATAQTFAAQGAEVVLVDLELDKATAAAASIAASGAKASGFACDVSSAASVEKTFAEIGGPVDMLVNCAG